MIILKKVKSDLTSDRMVYPASFGNGFSLYLSVGESSKHWGLNTV